MFLWGIVQDKPDRNGARLLIKSPVFIIAGFTNRIVKWNWAFKGIPLSADGVITVHNYYTVQYNKKLCLCQQDDLAINVCPYHSC